MHHMMSSARQAFSRVTFAREGRKHQHRGLSVGDDEEKGMKQYTIAIHNIKQLSMQVSKRRKFFKIWKRRKMKVLVSFLPSTSKIDYVTVTDSSLIAAPTGE